MSADMAARYVGLARALAWKWRRRLGFEEASGVASLALVTACRSFDPARATDPTLHLHCAIEHALSRASREEAWRGLKGTDTWRAPSRDIYGAEDDGAERPDHDAYSDDRAHRAMAEHRLRRSLPALAGMRPLSARAAKARARAGTPGASCGAAARMRLLASLLADPDGSLADHAGRLGIGTQTAHHHLATIRRNALALFGGVAP